VGTTRTIWATSKGWRIPGSHEAGAAITRVRGSIQAGTAIIAVAIALSSCGGSAAKSQASAASSPTASSSASTSAAPVKASASPSIRLANGIPAESPPAGYRWVGSTAQGVWFAVPNGWAAVDLSKLNVDQAVSRFRLKGVNSSVMKSALNELSQRHALFAADLASAVRSPHEFATNANASCSPTPVAPDASSVPALKAVARAQYAQIDAHVLTLRDATVDGDVGIRVEFTLTSTSGLTLTDTQYVVLTKSSHACTITLSSDNPRSFQRIFRTIGSTIRVS
jgi:hypothetical protein